MKREDVARGLRKMASESNNNVLTYILCAAADMLEADVLHGNERFVHESAIEQARAEERARIGEVLAQWIRKSGDPINPDEMVMIVERVCAPAGGKA